MSKITQGDRAAAQDYCNGLPPVFDLAAGQYRQLVETFLAGVLAERERCMLLAITTGAPIVTLDGVPAVNLTPIVVAIRDGSPSDPAPLKRNGRS